MKKLPNLSIFFPSLNDGKMLPYLITTASMVAGKISKKYEIIVINEGSSDDSKYILEELKKRMKFLKIITHRSNRGYGAALRSGFKNCRYSYVFYTDGDGQYSLEELPLLVSKMGKRIDVVNGYKRKRADSVIRRFIGLSYNTYTRYLYDLPIRDIDCDFRLIRKSVLDRIKLYSSSGTICLELILKLDTIGARFAEVEITHYPRLYGKSQFFSFRHLYKTYQEYVKIFTRNKRFKLKVLYSFLASKRHDLEYANNLLKQKTRINKRI